MKTLTSSILALFISVSSLFASSFTKYYHPGEDYNFYYPYHHYHYYHHRYYDRWNGHYGPRMKGEYDPSPKLPDQWWQPDWNGRYNDSWKGYRPAKPNEPRLKFYDREPEEKWFPGDPINTDKEFTNSMRNRYHQ